MIDEDAVRRTARNIRNNLTTLGRRLESGDDDQLLVWIIPDELASAPRPLRYHPRFGGSARALPREASDEVISWVERMVESGIQSVICMMHPKEIRHYQALELGASDVVECYRRHGLIVCHIPWDDPAHRSPEGRRTFADELIRIRGNALEAFKRLQKPVLLHCSAAIDRSPPVAAYIYQNSLQKSAI